MEDRNPLKFFINLASERPIEALAKELQQEEDSSHFSLDDLDENGELKNNLAGGADDLTAYVSSDYWYSSYFVENLPRKMLTEQSKSLQSIDNTLANMPDLNLAFSKLTEFISSLDAVVTKLQKADEMRLYPSVLGTVDSLKDELQKRKRRIIQPTQADKDPTSSPVKIQWLGQVNVLGTLFYHMLKGQDGGAPYISASVEQVKRMLVDNFVDSEGHDLSKATLDTILMPNRSEKRANIGDRIELPNKKLKK